MQATYPGICACGCDYKIFVGVTEIRFDDEIAGWVIATHPLKPPAICPKCNMALPVSGDCDNCV